MKQLPLILLLAGCWSTASFGGIFDDTEARQMITDLKKQNQEQDAKSQAQQERLGKLETQLKNLRIIELFNQPDATRDEVKQLRGQLEVLNHQIEATQKRQKDFYVDLDSRVRQLEPGGGGNSTDKPAEPAATVAPQPELPQGKPVIVKPQDKQAAASADTKQGGNETVNYDNALGSYKAGKYEDAIRSFSVFLKTYPESKLAANALYWIGMSQSAMRDYKTAIGTQQKLISLFPDGSKAPDAMLNIGMNQLELDDKKAAKKTFADLIAKYPIAPAADKARRLQQNLK